MKKKMSEQFYTSVQIISIRQEHIQSSEIIRNSIYLEAFGQVLYS